ncbi:hypothetical protein ABW19_dt0207284 [Dactylella cylindrospora]|nr:hypothetical protein ABW19_dt0207284 [Dactylella cylindrospora]
MADKAKILYTAPSHQVGGWVAKGFKRARVAVKKITNKMKTKPKKEERREEAVKTTKEERKVEQPASPQLALADIQSAVSAAVEPMMEEIRRLTARVDELQREAREAGLAASEAFRLLTYNNDDLADLLSVELGESVVDAFPGEDCPSDEEHWEGEPGEEPEEAVFDLGDPIALLRAVAESSQPSHESSVYLDYYEEPGPHVKVWVAEQRWRGGLAPHSWTPIGENGRESPGFAEGDGATSGRHPTPEQVEGRERLHTVLGEAVGSGRSTCEFSTQQGQQATAESDSGRERSALEGRCRQTLLAKADIEGEEEEEEGDGVDDEDTDEEEAAVGVGDEDEDPFGALEQGWSALENSLLAI